MAKYKITQEDGLAVNKGNGTLENPFKLEESTNFDIIKTIDFNVCYSEIPSFSYHENLQEVKNGHITNIENGGFSSCTALTSFTTDISLIQNGYRLFYNCSSLKTFNSSLTNLQNCGQMFYGCSSLTSVTSNLSNVVDGSSMFSYNTSLTSFNGDLSNLTNGSNMFGECSSLVSFTSNLSSLKFSASYMFRGCSSLNEVRVTTSGNNASLLTKSNLSIRSEAHLYVNGVEINE